MQSRGVLLVMFDLPVGTSAERRSYRTFRKALLKQGYRKLQNSVYVKLIKNAAAMQGALREAAVLAPGTGSVFALPLTLRAFKNLAALGTERFDMSGFSDDILYFAA